MRRQRHHAQTVLDERAPAGDGERDGRAAGGHGGTGAAEAAGAGRVAAMARAASHLHRFREHVSLAQPQRGRGAHGLQGPRPFHDLDGAPAAKNIPLF